MSDYTIKYNPMDTMARQCVDMAIHQALERFRGELGDAEGLVYKIARAAADTAVEQFRSYCNSQLRLIEVDHEMRVQKEMLKPLRYVISQAD